MNRIYTFTVGIGQYQHLSPLEKTTTDARDIDDILVKEYSTGQSALLLDQQATKAAINEKLNWFARNISSDDAFLLFFSGHGAQYIGGFNPGEYLCPVEADLRDLSSTAISDRELSNALRAIPAARLVVFLDACHSGGVGRPRDATLQTKAGLSDAAYTHLAEGRGRVVIASCRPEEVSWEFSNMRNGLFTHYLLKGLRGAAADASGVVHILDIFKYVSARVPEHHPEQHPYFKGEMDLNFALTRVDQIPSVVPPTDPLLLQAGSDSKMNMDSLSEDVEKERLEELIEVHKKRLHKLQVRVALEGRSARPEDEIEIESIQQRLSQLEQQHGNPANSQEETLAKINLENIDPTKLRRVLHSAYNRPDFEILCADLGLGYYDLPGEVLEVKMMHLVDYFRRRRRYKELVEKVLQDHPYLIDDLV